jgi:ribosomal protein S14
MMYTYAQSTRSVRVDVKCQRCGRDDRLTRVMFSRTEMRALCECGHVYAVEIAPGESLNVACDVLERNPLVAIGKRE